MPARRDPRSKSPTWLGVAGLGAVVAVLGLAAALQLGGLVRTPSLLPLAQVYDRRAEALQSSSPAAAASLTMASLRLAPASPAGWLRLAMLEVRRAGGWTPRAGLWLSRSYAVGPFDPAVVVSRTAFAYDHWADLDPQLQADAAEHVRGAWYVYPQQLQLLRAAQLVHDPRGKLALSALLFELRMRSYPASEKLRGDPLRAPDLPPVAP